jgi:hypothetical protein
MARFVHIEYSTQHGGVNRFARGLETASTLSLGHLALAALAAVGAPFTRAAAAVNARLGGWSERRELRRQDDKLWNIALADARVMADLSRAMSQDAARDVRAFN